MEYHIDLPLTPEKAKMLRAGDTVYLTGEIYTLSLHDALPI